MNTFEEIGEYPFLVRRYGPLAWLVSSESKLWLDALIAHCEARPLRLLQEYVLGFESVLFVFNETVQESYLRGWLFDVDVVNGSGSPLGYRTFSVPVRYGGLDLEALALAKNLSPEEVVARHCAPEYQVRLLGFSPGFPYLDGLDSSLNFPRKAVPVPRIEVGSVAIGGSHAGIYSIASPGGWHVLGKTDMTLFDPELARSDRMHASRSFALKPGDRIRFVAL